MNCLSAESAVSSALGSSINLALEAYIVKQKEQEEEEEEEEEEGENRIKKKKRKEKK